MLITTGSGLMSSQDKPADCAPHSPAGIGAGAAVSTVDTFRTGPVTAVVGVPVRSRVTAMFSGVGQAPGQPGQWPRPRAAPVVRHPGKRHDMKRLIARLWRIIRGPMQWRVLWLAHAKFMVGVTGVVRDDAGRVLLLRHRMWPEGRQWGLPTGYAIKGEEFGATVVREVREETGLDVKAGRLVHLKSGYKLRVEVAYDAALIGGELKIDSFEILEARWFSPDELPDGIQESHRALILGHATAD